MNADLAMAFATAAAPFVACALAAGAWVRWRG